MGESHQDALDIAFRKLLDKQTRLHRRLVLYALGTTLALLMSLIALALNAAPNFFQDTRLDPQNTVPSSQFHSDRLCIYR